MLRYVGRRMIVLGLSLLAASALIFGIVELVPGDPATFMLGTGAQADTVASLRRQMGVDQPLPLRYAVWLGGILYGDFGSSLTLKTPIAGMIAERLQVSLPLALLALLLAIAMALPVGFHAAARRGRTGDVLAMGLSSSASPCRISGWRCFWFWSLRSGCAGCPRGAFPAGPIPLRRCGR